MIGEMKIFHIFVCWVVVLVQYVVVAGDSSSDNTPRKRIVLGSLGVLGHAVPLARLGAELASLCCSRHENCFVDFASHSPAKVWWDEETVAVRDSPCLGNFVDLGLLPSDWGEKLNRFSKDPSLFRGTLSVFADLYLEALPPLFLSMADVLKGASLLVVDVGTLGAVERARGMNIPLVIHSPTIWADTFSQFEPPHWLPAFGSGFSKEMSLAERCLNALLPRLLSVALQPALMKVNKMRFEAMLDPYQSSHQVLQDIRVISSTAFGFDYARSIPQLHAFVGPILPKRSKPYEYSQAMQDFIGRKPRIVLIRFGSLVVLEEPAVLAFKEALKSLVEKEKFTVVWFAPPPTLLIEAKETLGDDFFLVEKFDVDLNQALLQNERTVLSISSCGMAATQEPLFYKIPVLCVPLVADQADVAARLQDTGAGIVISKEEISAALVSDSITRLIFGDSFAKNAFRISRAYKFAGGRERAALHVLSAFYSTDHLLLKRSLAWHKRVGLDVFAVFISLFFSVSAGIFVVYRFRQQRHS